MERRPAVHLNGFVGVMGEDEHRRVIRRLVAPPAAPVTFPLATDRTEHVTTHDVRTAGRRQLIARADVSLVTGLAGPLMPLVVPETPDANRVVAALVRSGDEAVERDGHVTGHAGHSAPSKLSETCVWVCVTLLP